MAPIRVGLIGLSPDNSGAGVGGWAIGALLPTFTESPYYELVAITGSTLERAQQSIKNYNLSSSVKAYETAEDLANDPDVDMVAISVRVQKHYEMILPALKKKKQLYLEWPLFPTVSQSEEIVKLVQEQGLKTIVGVQARASGLVHHIKKILASGEIGQITNTSVLGSLSNLPTGVWFQGGEYLLNMESGGNSFMIQFGHFMDSFVDVLGDFDSLTSILKRHRDTVTIVDSQGNVVDPAFPVRTPDHFLVQGTLENGAVASINYRTGESTVDGKGLRWTITGTKGEILVTIPEDFWQFTNGNRTLQVKIGKEGETRDVDHTQVDFDVPTWGADISKNTGAILTAYAKGDKDRYADFASALRSQKLLQRIIDASAYKEAE